MSDHRRASRSAAPFNPPNPAFDFVSKQLWGEEVARIIRASKRTQRRLAEWVPELTNVNPPVVAPTRMDSLKKLKKKDQASRLQGEISKQLHARYDSVAIDKLPPRFEELLQRFENTLH